MFPALVDKNLLPRIFPDSEQPHTIVKNYNGFFFSDQNEMLSLELAIEILSKNERFIIKPSIDSGGGKKVMLVSGKEKTPQSYREEIGALLNKYNSDFLAQEVMEQSSEFSILNPSSLNTMRLMTLLYVRSETNEAGTIFSGVKIKNYDAVLKQVQSLHLKVPYFRLISWDIGQNKHYKPVLIEFNVFYQEINSHQITNGPVLYELVRELIKGS